MFFERKFKFVHIYSFGGFAKRFLCTMHNNPTTRVQKTPCASLFHPVLAGVPLPPTDTIFSSPRVFSRHLMNIYSIPHPKMYIYSAHKIHSPLSVNPCARPPYCTTPSLYALRHTPRRIISYVEKTLRGVKTLGLHSPVSYFSFVALYVL